MTRHDDLEGKLARWFEAEALSPAPAGRSQLAIEAARNRRPRPALLAGFGSAWNEVAPAPHMAWRVAVALLILALAAGAVIVGSQQRRLPPLVGPAGNGLIAYAYAGDVFVGDPSSGATTAIVTGPESDSQPIFSPDGTYIGFVRHHDVAVDPAGDRANPIDGWDPIGTFDIVVVRPDGSDLRVITRERLVGLDLSGWTPDGTFLVAEHLEKIGPDRGWRQMAFDAVGSAEPRSMGDVWPGHDPNGLRSPTGDQVLLVSEVPGQPPTLSVMSADGTESKVLVDRPRLNFVYAWLGQPVWSPDGSRIAFSVAVEDDALVCGPFPCVEERIYVMHADGSDLRSLARDPGAVTREAFVSEENLSWSADSSKIVMDRRLTFVTRTHGIGPFRPPLQTTCCTVVVVGVETGDERMLDVAALGYQSIDGFDSRSWSPDGRTLLFADYLRNRLAMLDLDTMRATELPWRVGLAPSWQRVAPTAPG